MKRLCVFLTVLLIGGATLAQELRVDLLVFRNGPLPADSAFWTASPLLPPCDAVTLQPEGGLLASFTRGQPGCRPRTGRSAPGGGLNLVPDSLLATHSTRLRQNQYVLLATRSWRQTVPGGAPVMIQPAVPEAGNPSVEGTVAVSGDSKSATVSFELALRHRDAGGAVRHAVLQESRPAKPGEIHYFDHPLFGALLLVSAP